MPSKFTRRQPSILDSRPRTPFVALALSLYGKEDASVLRPPTRAVATAHISTRVPAASRQGNKHSRSYIYDMHTLGSDEGERRKARCMSAYVARMQSNNTPTRTPAAVITGCGLAIVYVYVYLLHCIV